MRLSDVDVLSVKGNEHQVAMSPGTVMFTAGHDQTALYTMIINIYGMELYKLSNSALAYFEQVKVLAWYHGRCGRQHSD